MALSDFQSALSTLRTHITNEAWDSARKQLLICRSWLAELPLDGSIGPLAFKLNVEQLDEMAKEIQAEAPTGGSTTRRILHTRTNYASR